MRSKLNSPKKILAFSALDRISTKCCDKQLKESKELSAKTKRAASANL